MLAPGSVWQAEIRTLEAEPPLPVPAECTVKVRKMLTVSETASLRLRIILEDEIQA